MKRRLALLFSITFVLVLCTECGLWLHRERQQYALNRQLIDALERSEANRALVLVNAGADPNTRLAPASAPSLILLLTQLLPHKALPANDSPTAFMYACGDLSLTWSNKHLVHMSVTNESLPLLKAMLAHGANIHPRGMNNWTALHCAAHQYRLHTTELLLQYGADINALGSGHVTPLMVVPLGASAKMFHLLLSHGANPNVQYSNGDTILHQVILSRAPNDLITELLAGGANPDIKNQIGNTPLQCAQKLGRPDLVRLLKQHGAK